jgi:hypothetical protein
MRLQHGPSTRPPILQRLRTETGWSVRSALWPGFDRALSLLQQQLAQAARDDRDGDAAAIADPIAADEEVLLKLSCAILKNGKRVYATDSFQGAPWYTHVALDLEGADLESYARVELLFTFRSVPLSICRLHRALRAAADFDDDFSQPQLPDVLYWSFTTHGEPWNGDEELEPNWDIVPRSLPCAASF